MTVESRVRDADRAADARARLYAREIRHLLGRFEDEQRGVDWPEEQADALGLFFADLRGVLDRMDEGGDTVDFDSLVAEGATVLPFSKAAQLERAGGGIGQKNSAVSNVTQIRGAVSKLRRRGSIVGVIVADIWREDLGPCAVCTIEGGSCRGPVQGHHIIAKKTLKKLGFVEYLLDKRNRLAVCEHRHEQHTNGYKPIPRAALPESVFEFAEELGLTWYLDRHYVADGGAA